MFFLFFFLFFGWETWHALNRAEKWNPHQSRKRTKKTSKFEHVTKEAKTNTEFGGSHYHDFSSTLIGESKEIREIDSSDWEDSSLFFMMCVSQLELSVCIKLWKCFLRLKLDCQNPHIETPSHNLVLSCLVDISLFSAIFSFK